MTVLTIIFSLLAIILSWCSIMDFWDGWKGKNSEIERSEDESEDT